jgi:hypothetical protein
MLQRENYAFTGEEFVSRVCVRKNLASRILGVLCWPTILASDKTVTLKSKKRWPGASSSTTTAGCGKGDGNNLIKNVKRCNKLVLILRWRGGGALWFLHTQTTSTTCVRPEDKHAVEGALQNSIVYSRIDGTLKMACGFYRQTRRYLCSLYHNWTV